MRSGSAERKRFSQIAATGMHTFPGPSALWGCSFLRMKHHTPQPMTGRRQVSKHLPVAAALLQCTQRSDWLKHARTAAEKSSFLSEVDEQQSLRNMHNSNRCAPASTHDIKSASCRQLHSVGALTNNCIQRGSRYSDARSSLRVKIQFGKQVEGLIA